MEWCLWNGLERPGFPVLSLSGGVGTAPAGGDEGASRERLRSWGSKKDKWVYPGQKPGCQNRNPGLNMCGLGRARGSWEAEDYHRRDHT